MSKQTADVIELECQKAVDTINHLQNIFNELKSHLFKRKFDLIEETVRLVISRRHPKLLRRIILAKEQAEIHLAAAKYRKELTSLSLQKLCIAQKTIAALQAEMDVFKLLQQENEQRSLTIKPKPSKSKVVISKENTKRRHRRSAGIVSRLACSSTATYMNLYSCMETISDPSNPTHPEKILFSVDSAHVSDDVHSMGTNCENRSVHSEHCSTENNSLLCHPKVKHGCKPKRCKYLLSSRKRDRKCRKPLLNNANLLEGATKSATKPRCEELASDYSPMFSDTMHLFPRPFTKHVDRAVTH